MKKRKQFKVYVPLILVIGAVLSGVIYWYIEFNKYIKTDDALIASDNVSVSSKIVGRISKLYIEEGDSVKQGQLVAELDSVDLLAQKQQLIAAMQQSIANQQQVEAKYAYDKQNINVYDISVSKANDDFDRAQKQYTGGVITTEQYDHLKKAKETAEAQRKMALAQLDVSKTQVESSAAAIKTAKAQVDVISTQLKNTKLYAPVSGIVAKRWLLAGDVVQPGQSIYTITNTNKFWVLVYLEETKMGGMKIGDEASFTIDMYPEYEFSGKIYLIGNSTAAQFSLIPPSNASGNFTKVAQRIPLRISIDGVNNQASLSQFTFRTGMSAEVKIKK
jgi:membrane fusion protein (multidrug efflux system)